MDNINSIINDLKTDLNALIKRFLTIQSLFEQIKILKQWETSSRVEAIQRGAYFFTLVKISFRKSIEIDLHTLYEYKSKTSLIKWLRRARAYAETGNNDFSKLTSAQYIKAIDSHLKRIEDNSDLIKKVKDRRDKFWAHIDIEYFKDPNKLYTKIPVLESDLEKLIKLSREIMEYHYEKWFDADLTIEVKSISNIDEVLRHVRAFNRVWRDKNLSRNGVQLYVYKKDNYIEGSSLKDSSHQFIKP